MNRLSVIVEAPLTPIAAEFVDALRTLDLERTMQHMSPDASLHAGSRIVANGKAHVRRILLAVFASLNAICYRPAATWSKDGVSVIEADVTVEWDDGAIFRLPLTMILRVRYNLIVNIHVCWYEPELPAHLASSIRLRWVVNGAVCA